ncbi:PKD domain-containing protein [Reichenbachiella sp. MALMAid0571]|uniref:PKD domain-containing protein n=1 Tax=Reichenbachiella sp. MALMAid0571 TaxID=3143939 RepID=UPI0032DEF4D6
MKKLLHLFLFVGLAVLASCGGDDPLPSPVVSFITDPGVVEVGVPVQFENQSLKASSYLWDFGGGVTSEEISPTVTFDSRGDLYVKLTAKTDDGQMVIDSVLVSVKERVLTGYYVNIFPSTNGDEAWDPEEEGSAQYADILIQLYPTDDNNTDGLLDGIFVDWPYGPLAAEVESNVFGEITLTDDDWVLVLYDYDGDLEADFDETKLATMTGVQFNPVQSITYKSDDETSGFLSVLFTDSNNNTLDVDLTFEIK